MKQIVSMLILVLVTVSSYTAEPGLVVNRQEGFRIATLEATPEARSHQILIMFLPVDDGYAPSVNIMTQDFDGTLAEYKEITESQFQQLGLNTIINKIEDDIYIIEYSGVIQGKYLHVYSKATQRGSSVYLVTGTAANAQWGKYHDQLIDVVNSFQLVN